MTLHGLPNELLLRIARFVLKCPICECHHASNHLSALACSSAHLHFVLTPELLRTASALQIPLWGIAHDRQDTVTLAVDLGADPNVPLRETHRAPLTSDHVFLGTPLEIAIRMRRRSMGRASEQPSLDTCTTLLRAGGKLTIECVSTVVDSGDLDLLRCCMPYISDINTRNTDDGPTLLELAGCNGQVDIVAFLLAAGAIVNSTGPPDSPHYFPPLWTLCDAPLPVLRLLLATGADTAWEHEGCSIIQFMREHRPGSRDLDDNVDLLVQHGARVPTGEEAIMLGQAPVRESGTEGGEVQLEEHGLVEVVDRPPRTDTLQVHTSHHGWDFVGSSTWDEWGLTWRNQELDPGCMCPTCPLETTGGYRAVRAQVS